MKLAVQVTDDSGTERYSTTLELPDELFTAPRSTDVGLLGVRTAVDYALFQAEERERNTDA